MRYFLRIAYVGTRYAGWQAQQNATAVQQVLTERLSQVLWQQVDVVGSGRTDAGVHALGQVAHVEIADEFDPHWVLRRLNACLPPAIVVRAMLPVQTTAHARYDANKRYYVYCVHTAKHPFLRESSYYYPHALCLTTMNQAAEQLLGTQTFASLSRKQQYTPQEATCTLYSARWKPLPSCAATRYTFTIVANRFLRGMVRACVGLLLQVGTGKLPTNAVAQALQAPQRLPAVITAPPQGLYLAAVHYPCSIFDGKTIYHRR